MHVYQMRSSNSAIVSATEQRMNTCMKGLKEVSKVWLVAKMVHTLFESILGNKSLEERLQKAAGRKHVQAKRSNGRPSMPQSRTSQQQDATKRKYEDFEMGYSNSTPSAQMSYERSRPQTPSLTPSKELPPQQTMPTIAAPQQTSSPHMPRNDTFMGASRAATRQGTPFNGVSSGSNFADPPPDLFLVTRNSPTISQDVFNNFQPDQLFPAETNLQFPNFSPTQQHNAFIDPTLGSAPPSSATMHPPTTSGSTNTIQQQLQQTATPQTQPGQQPGFPPMTHRASIPSSTSHEASFQPMNSDANAWAQQLQALTSQQQQFNPTHPQLQDDNWSNSSISQGPTVPTALNVEDWFQFFGINGAPSGGGGAQEGMTGFG